MIRVAHLGSRPLGRECLQLLDEAVGIEVACVVTYPPDHDGWWDGSLYNLATDLGYPVVDESELFKYDLDYLISTLYYNILNGELLEHPTHGGLNLHQAELPRYRGSHSFSHAILNARGDECWRYGTTLHFMSEDVDAGDIVDRRFVELTESDTARSLYEKTQEKSVELFEDMLPHIASTKINGMGTPQDEFEGPVYYYSSDELEDLKEIPAEWLDDESMQERVHDRVRAVEFPPFKPAFIKLGDDQVYLTTQEYGGLL